MTDFEWNGDEIVRSVLEAQKAKLYEQGLDLQEKAQELAPVKEGFLRGSAKTEAVENGTKVIVSFSAVEGDCNYAIVQHEELDFKHPKGGQAKYLEQPFNENKERYLQEIADVTKEVIG